MEAMFATIQGKLILWSFGYVFGHICWIIEVPEGEIPEGHPLTIRSNHWKWYHGLILDLWIQPLKWLKTKPSDLLPKP